VLPALPSGLTESLTNVEAGLVVRGNMHHDYFRAMIAGTGQHG
jgi:hypothetical protein